MKKRLSVILSTVAVSSLLLCTTAFAKPVYNISTSYDFAKSESIAIHTPLGASVKSASAEIAKTTTATGLSTKDLGIYNRVATGDLYKDLSTVSRAGSLNLFGR